MFEILSQSTENCLVVHFSGKPTSQEYQHFLDTLEGRLERTAELNLVLVLSGLQFYGDFEAFRKDIKFSRGEYKRIHRAALAGVLLIDVLQGMMIGLLASLVFVVYRSSRPHLSSLGRVPGVPGAYSDMSRHPENMPVPGVLILRLDGPIYYANALTVRDRVKAMIEKAESFPRAVIFDASAQDQIDLTSTDMLKSLIKELCAKGIAVYVADVHAPVREFSRRAGLLEFIGEDHAFPTVDLAARFVETTM